ncbi:unnamed protein product [Pipistrellus nathusii]|uniref:Uncharacterized protein n=1 Tax=Pipistrellus nathusii TaxID=59473 RepID=A0ABN9ZFU6_PIPNA
MNTQGTHKPFPINYMGFQSARVRAGSAPAPRRRHPSNRGASGTDGGCPWARQPIDRLPGAAGWNVFLFDFPAKMPAVPLKGSHPIGMGPPPGPQRRPCGIAVGICLVVQSSSWRGKQREKREQE